MRKGAAEAAEIAWIIAVRCGDSLHAQVHMWNVRICMRVHCRQPAARRLQGMLYPTCASADASLGSKLKLLL